MKLSDIFVILLFIIPGAIAERISYCLDMPSANKRSEFRELLNGILWSLPILILVSPIMCVIYKIWHIKEFTQKFDDVLFLLVFGAASLIFAVIIGFIKGLFWHFITDLINKLRQKGNKIKIDSKGCWEKFFLVDPECHFVEIIKGTDVYEGFTREYSLPDEEKELIIYTPDYLQRDPHYAEYRDKFKIVNQTYVNIEKNIVIKDYDMKDYYSWMEVKIKELKKD